jgi:ABC-2 type transport system ATP-binding protein
LGKDPVIASLIGVHKRYGGIDALNGLSLDVHRGELVAILGPNGAGKSTAISLLLGLQAPTSGSATLFGESPHSVAARRNVGVMMQDVTLAPDFRIRDLIELTSSYYADPLPLQEVLELTQLTGLSNRPYGKLSGGQKRLAQFAMALCGRPSLIFLDEPTVGLDIKARERMWATVRELVEHGTSVVLTTHYLEEAEALADRVIVLAKGRIVASGSVTDIRAIVGRKTIRCVTSLPPEYVREWPGVSAVAADRDALLISVTDAEKIVYRLLSADSAVRDLEVTRAGLAEAFTELTEEKMQ